MKENNSRNNKLSLNAKVFFPPIIILVLTIIYSLSDNDGFLEKANAANQWILQTFGWLFTWSTFIFLIILLAVYFSPLGKIRIGGEKAAPLLTKWRWFAITLCTTIATGILFWGMAEPLYHLHGPPDSLGIAGKSEAAIEFSISTMFMHWSITPYGIYTITGLAFALAYYNLKQPFSISALVFSVAGKLPNSNIGAFLDVVVLYGLVAGMAASLGGGIFAMMGGMETTMHIPKTGWMLGIIGLSVVLTFIVSAMSGLQKGIRILSDINIRAFMVLAIFVFIFGPTAEILEYLWLGLKDYVTNFLPRSTNLGANLDADWQNSWTIFYWANWFAWAPVAALFLGRIALGYTVRDFIHFNLLLPSLFAILWMSIFSGSAIHFDVLNQFEIFELMSARGEESVMYRVFEELPLGQVISIFTLVIIFISYVTAADSNVSAMSAMSTRGINPENPEAPIVVKIIWGSLIGLIAWIMITTAGIDGIRLLSVLGGFPALFLIILAAVGVVRMMWKGLGKNEGFDSRY